MLNKKYTQWFTQSTIDTLEAYGNCKIIKLFVGKYNIFYRFFRFSILNVLSDVAWSKELYKRNSNKLKHTIRYQTEKDVKLFKKGGFQINSSFRPSGGYREMQRKRDRGLS